MTKIEILKLLPPEFSVLIVWFVVPFAILIILDKLIQVIKDGIELFRSIKKK